MQKPFFLSLLTCILLSACEPGPQQFVAFNNAIVRVLDSARSKMNTVTMTLNIGYRMDGDSILNEKALADTFRSYQRQYADFTKQAKQITAPDELTAEVQQKAVVLLETYEQLVDGYENIRTLKLQVAKGQLAEAEMQAKAKAIEKTQLKILLKVQKEFQEAHHKFLAREGLEPTASLE